MLKSALDRYVAELRASGQPVFTVDDQILCGRMVITVSPSVEKPERLRLEFPGNYTPAESPLVFALLQAVFGSAQVWMPAWQRAGAALAVWGKYEERLGDYQVRSCPKAGQWILEIEATSPPATGTTPPEP